MGRISDLVQQALKTGYLSLAAEEQLRSLLQVKNAPEELMAFLQLQQAAMEGIVKQESRELVNSHKLRV
jgi:hypothetical protein